MMVALATASYAAKSHARPLLSILIPCLNEVRFLGRCLESVLANDYPAERTEVLVIDGGSTDGTRDLIALWAARYAHVRLIENPDATAPHAMNRGIAAARGKVIARVDAHAAVARDYFSRCVARLESPGVDGGGAVDNVGGVMRTLAQDTGLCAGPILAALSHRFGIGNSYFRLGTDEPRLVDTVFGGCWRREVFAQVGGFNPQLTRSQDMEFSLRLKAAGLKTLLDPAVRCDYYARTRPLAFLRHNFINGEWAILPFAYSSIVPVAARHLIPLIFVCALALALGMARWSLAPLTLLGLPYLSLSLAAAVQIAWQKRNATYLVAMPVVFFILHLGYGVGSLSGVIKTAHALRHPMLSTSQDKSCIPQP